MEANIGNRRLEGHWLAGLDWPCCKAWMQKRLKVRMSWCMPCTMGVGAPKVHFVGDRWQILAEGKNQDRLLLSQIKDLLHFCDP